MAPVPSDLHSSNVSESLGCLLSLLREASVDVLVLTDPNTIYYYLGYATPGGSLAALVVRGGEGEDGSDVGAVSCTMVARDLEITNLHPKWCACVETSPYTEGDPVDAVARGVVAGVEAGTPPPSTRRTPCFPLRVGYEASSQKLSPRDCASLVARVDALLLARGAEWVDVSPLAVGKRACKDDREVECLRRAASYVSSAYSALSHARASLLKRGGEAGALR